MATRDTTQSPINERLRRFAVLPEKSPKPVRFPFALAAIIRFPMPRFAGSSMSTVAKTLRLCTLTLTWIGHPENLAAFTIRAVS